METTLKISCAILGFISLLGFSGALVAGFILPHYFDDGDKSTFMNRWQSTVRLLSKEYYREEGWPYWRMRDLGLKVFFISMGLLAILAVIATISGVTLPMKSE